MTPSKQKRLRTNNASGRTLHDFFSANLVSTQIQGQPQKLGSSESSRKTTSTKTGSEQEVIVIDSDSDDALEIAEKTSLFNKRRKLSPRNSVGLIIGSKGDSDPTPIDAYKSIHSKEDSIPCIQRVGGKHCQGEIISFGRPFLLCSSPMEDKPLGREDNAQHDEPFSLEASNTSQTFGLSASSLGCPKVDIDLTLDDWDNGDDEVVTDSMANHVLALQNGLELEWEPDFPAQQEDDQTHPSGGDEEESAFCLHQELASDSSEKVKHTQEKPLQKNRNNAFSLLMSSVKEKEVWKEADAAGDKSCHTNAAYARRKAPFYKVLQGMPIAVDAFSYGAIPGVNAYFLSHAHSDHYTNLSSRWKNGPIYCSEGTANLIMHMLNVDKKWVQPLPMDMPTTIPNSNGVTVTLIEANHCPGSCLFFFEGPQSVNAGDSNFKSPFVGSSKIFRYLHCGDFRASPQHVLHPVLRGKTIDHVYLDTTYLNPRYTFPPQPLVISACAELARKVVCGEQLNEASGMSSWLAKGKEKDIPKPLILVGTYSIGKERIVKAIAHAVNSRIYCDIRKASILRCQADPELDGLLTSDPKDSIVHLVPLATISTDRLKFYLERLKGAYDRVIGFRPTGWTYTQSPGADLSPSITTILTKTSEQNFSHLDLRLSPKSTSMIQLYSVPYSEHSSFNELTCFAMSFNWVKIIATVNVGSESSRAKMAKWFAKWEAERKKRVTDTIVPYRHPHYW